MSHIKHLQVCFTRDRTVIPQDGLKKGHAFVSTQDTDFLLSDVLSLKTKRNIN